MRPNKYEGVMSGQAGNQLRLSRTKQLWSETLCIRETGWRFLSR